ncbi:MAG TPA: hypothetical protein DEP47_08070 [Chloroflexi bacterium]|nr:hypothetical protein [Chloroflexota bacterium]
MVGKNHRGAIRYKHKELIKKLKHRDWREKMFNFNKDDQISESLQQRLLNQSEQEHMAKSSRLARSWALAHSFRKALKNFTDLIMSDGTGKGSFVTYYTAGLGGSRG